LQYPLLEYDFISNNQNTESNKYNKINLKNNKTELKIEFKGIEYKKIFFLIRPCS